MRTLLPLALLAAALPAAAALQKVEERLEFAIQGRPGGLPRAGDKPRPSR